MGCTGFLHTSDVKTHSLLKSQKSPNMLPSKDEMVHLGKQGACCGGMKQQPCSLCVTAHRFLPQPQEPPGRPIRFESPKYIEAGVLSSCK